MTQTPSNTNTSHLRKRLRPTGQPFRTSSPITDDRPVLLHTVLEARNCRGLAEFYRRLLGLQYRKGDEPPADPSADTADWLVLLNPSGQRVIAIQANPDTRPSTWPSDEIPMQMHLDFTVSSTQALDPHRSRAEQLGARLLFDRSTDKHEPLYVMADPEGHPFCLFVP